MEEKKCKRTFFEREENGSYKKIVKEVPCLKKKRCERGLLKYDTKDGRKAGNLCKDDGRNG